MSGFECIVVDNSTNDETQRLFKRRDGMVYTRVNAPLGSQPLLRNAALELAKGEIVCFLDDDGYPEPNWLEELMKCYADPMVGGAGGRILQGQSTTVREKVGRFRLVGGVEGNWNYGGPEMFEVDHLQGTNMSFRRSVLQEIGGWDERYCGGYATYEEPDVCLRVKKLGYKILFNPKAAVTHGEAQREGSFGRSVTASPRLAYYTGRNGTYMYLKNLGWSPRVMTAALVANPAIEIVRCLFGSARKPDLRRLRLVGFNAVVLHLLGVISGVSLSLRYVLSRFSARK
jgi:GT2 family glycosyltransferase